MTTARPRAHDGQRATHDRRLRRLDKYARGTELRADDERADLKLVGKEKGQKPVYMSTEEFRSHADPLTAEKEIRAQKAKLHDGIFDSVVERQARLGVNMMRPHDAK